ncbi:MAG TPA: hypothetical protein VKB79_29725 [Bryobacteraceae bacterium]|nr:hypothetical protein [Bryobacteraceae bacterium]
MRFRYSYLYRLIDDNELRGLSPAIRVEIRKVHKEAYWKNIALLRRDAAHVLKLRRHMMAARKDWDFSALVNDYARVQYLLATLTLAGLTHATRIPSGITAVRTACDEFESLFSDASPRAVAALV